MDRLRRLGASEATVTMMREAWSSLDADGRAQWLRDLNVSTDAEVRAELETYSSVPQGTVAEVLDWVGADKSRAAQAIHAEDEGRKRSGLLKTLHGIADAAG